VDEAWYQATKPTGKAVKELANESGHRCHVGLAPDDLGDQSEAPRIAETVFDPIARYRDSCPSCVSRDRAGRRLCAQERLEAAIKGRRSPTSSRCRGQSREVRVRDRGDQVVRNLTRNFSPGDSCDQQRNTCARGTGRRKARAGRNQDHQHRGGIIRHTDAHQGRRKRINRLTNADDGDFRIEPGQRPGIAASSANGSPVTSMTPALCESASDMMITPMAASIPCTTVIGRTRPGCRSGSSRR